MFTGSFVALWNVVVQTAGVSDGMVNGPQLILPTLGVILFIVFIIAMPILFSNFLVSALIAMCMMHIKISIGWCGC